MKVPVIGWIKTYERLPVDCQPKSLTLSRTADSWFIIWKIETELTEPIKSVPVVGVDLVLRSPQDKQILDLLRKVCPE